MNDIEERLDEILKDCQRRSANRIDHFKDDTVDSLNRRDVKQAILALKEHERTMGHRMEAFTAWDGYIRFCNSRNHKVNISYAYSLYRRYNELTDMAQSELRAMGLDASKLAHYEMDFTDGSVGKESVGGDFEIKQLTKSETTK